MTSRIGFIGLGVMGRPMAANLLGAGLVLVVHTRTRSTAAELEERGAIWADTPADVARASDVVVTMLPDSPQVEAVAEGSDGLLSGAHAGLIWIDMSSIAPLTARRLAAAAENHGVTALDAPVSG